MSKRKNWPKAIPCAFCGKGFDPSKGQRRFCRDECRIAYWAEQRRSPPEETRCPNCQKAFIKNTANHTYCSEACQAAATDYVSLPCSFCDKPYRAHRSALAKEYNHYCSPACRRAGQKVMITKRCQQCDEPFSFKSAGKTINEERKFCSKRCVAIWRQAHRTGPVFGGQRGRKTPVSEEQKRATSERMKANNPSKRPEVQAKISKAKSGRTFLSRGGNSQITTPQRMLAEALLAVEYMEYAIPTKPVKGQFPSLPTSYKVDVALPRIKLAIEVDGKSHKNPKWQFLDKRKTEVLQALGWSVLRFWNDEVTNSLEECVRKVNQFMTSR